jgi:hypothetical protein
MTPEVWDPKNCRKTSKMWNHSKLEKHVGGHQYTLGLKCIQIKEISENADGEVEEELKQKIDEIVVGSLRYVSYFKPC